MDILYSKLAFTEFFPTCPIGFLPIHESIARCLLERRLGNCCGSSSNLYQFFWAAKAPVKHLIGALVTVLTSWLLTALGLMNFFFQILLMFFISQVLITKWGLYLHSACSTDTSQVCLGRSENLSECIDHPVPQVCNNLPPL